MKLLAIDTSSDACSVAVQSGDVIVENHAVKPREHTRILMPMIRQSLADVGLAPTDLDAVVLGNGPGSFIGMRIGASVAQGICYGAGLKIVPVSSLAAVAAEVLAQHNASRVVVVQDARMNEVYVGCYAGTVEGTAQLLGEEQICEVGLLESLPDEAVVAGAAWQKYDVLLAANREQIAVVSDVIMPRAKFLLTLCPDACIAEHGIAPELLIPAYIRTKVAEIPVATQPV